MMDLIISILSGLVTAIPLVVALVKFVTKAIKQKNWTSLVSMVSQFMAEAETRFSEGATKKEWVLAMVETSAKSINFDIDIDEVSEIIDELCKMSKKVNK